MARPERHDADYFPFYVKDGKTLFILESKYGLQGIGFFTNLMRFLTRQTDHHICIQDESDRLYFFAQIRCPEDIGMDMIGLMVKTGKIDSILWDEKRVIVSDDLLKSLKDAYKNRNNPIISIDQIRVSYQIIPVTYQGNTAHAELNPKIDDHNPQRKGKETKGKESIEVGLSDLPVDNSQKEAPLEKDPDTLLFELRGLMEDIGKKMPDVRKQRQVMLFIEANIVKKNHRAMLACIKSLQKQLQNGVEIEAPKQYLEAALKIEDGKHNAQDYERETAEKKKPTTVRGMAAMSQIMAGMGRGSPCP